MENMAQITTQKITFGDLVNKMVSLRENGDSAIVKRENFLEFPDINDNIEYNKKNFLSFASFGYMERLFRKLSSHYGDKKFAQVKIMSYREACGFFAGNLEVEFENSAGNLNDQVEFAWAGKGEIENTWDSFNTWKTSERL